MRSFGRKEDAGQQGFASWSSCVAATSGESTVGSVQRKVLRKANVFLYVFTPICSSKRSQMHYKICNSAVIDAVLSIG